MTPRERLFVVLSCIVTLILAGFAFSEAETTGGRVERQNSKLSVQLVVVCQEHRLLAQIAQEQLEEQQASTEHILPKIKFPGLSPQQLRTLTERKELKEARHVGALENISRETC